MAAAYIGCVHYQRKCKFITPCCNKTYTCRFCHDESENHVLNRKSVKELICSCCKTRQQVRSSCNKCRTQFGKYFCLECNLFDDEFKGQFHCADCGICRVGGESNFYHCPICNMCLNINLMGNHKCVENRSRTDCPICVEDLHSSRLELFLPRCGHLLHKECSNKLKEAGHSTCPICKSRF